MSAAGAVILAVIATAFFVGRHHPAVTVRHGQALSAVGTISAQVGSDSFYIPRDVPWVAADGSYRQDGRPECLPPVGVGSLAVTFATVELEDPSGVKLARTIWVDCTGWDPSDLTPQQAENARIDGTEDY